MNTSRGFASLVLILIIIGLVVLGGPRIIKTRQSTSTQQVTSGNSPTTEPVTPQTVTTQPTIPVAPVTVTASFSPAHVSSPNGITTLTWSSKGATYCKSFDVATGLITTLAVSGSFDTSPSASPNGPSGDTVTITCYDSAGQASKPVTTRFDYY